MDNAIATLMATLDDHKQQMPEGVYLELCEKIQLLHQQRAQPVEPTADWLNPTLYVSEGSIPSRQIAHPARSAALASQGRPTALYDDELALAPGPPDASPRFRYTFTLPAAACVYSDIDLRECERYRFDKGVLQIDPGNGHVEQVPAHVTHVWDMHHNEGRLSQLTMEDTGADQEELYEDIGVVGVAWHYGWELARDTDDQ